jgi:HD-GYP domain-containing protein (c-di-GMP phosphodiesterase class II)
MAALLNVTPQTIKNYIYSCRIKALRTPGGHHRIRRIDLKSLGFDVEEAKGQENLSMEEPRDAYYRITGAFVSTVESLIKALDTRDIVSSGHSSRVADLSCDVGDIMGFPEKELQDLKLGALLHDVGKIGISEVILGKPGRLTDQEYFLVKKHSEIGERIVAETEDLRPIASSVRHCHERFDGKGYPDNIGGSDIELNSRIIAVADAYDFLRSELSFRSALSVNDALQEIKNSSGTQFDPAVVKNFVDSIKGSSSAYR